MNLIKNKDIDIMMPVIGGYNSGSLLPYLDFKVEILKNCTPNPNFKIWGKLKIF